MPMQRRRGVHSFPVFKKLAEDKRVQTINTSFHKHILEIVSM
jgi:hypothetical protein